MTSPIHSFRPATFVQPTTRTATQTQAQGTRQTGGDAFVSGGGTSTPSRAAADEAISRLRNLGSVSANGDTFRLDEWFSPADIASERGAYEDRINALANQQPPLSPAELTSQANEIIGEFEQLSAAVAMSIQNMLVVMMQNNMNMTMQALQG